MSNLKSAKAAIQAELAHTKEGLAFYQLRIDALEKTLSQLASIAGGSSDVPPVTNTAPAKSAPKVVATKPANPVKAVKPAKIAKGAKPTTTEKPVKSAMKAKGAKESAGGNDLPFTGGDYWTNLLTEHPQSASDILNAAISKLGFMATKAQTQKLAGRMTFALNALVKTKKIQDSGKGRDRRFFKA